MRSHDGRRRHRLARCLRTWVRRYLVLELAAWGGAVGTGCVVHAWTGNLGLMALAGIAGESLGFYGAALLRARRGEPDRPWSAHLRTVLAEFAAAELLDVVLTRPVALVVATRLTGSPALGILIGGLAADVLFYGTAGRLARRRARRTRSSDPARLPPISVAVSLLLPGGARGATSPSRDGRSRRCSPEPRPRGSPRRGCSPRAPPPRPGTPSRRPDARRRPKGARRPGACPAGRRSAPGRPAGPPRSRSRGGGRRGHAPGDRTIRSPRSTSTSRTRYCPLTRLASTTTSAALGSRPTRRRTSSGTSCVPFPRASFAPR